MTFWPQTSSFSFERDFKKLKYFRSKKEDIGTRLAKALKSSGVAITVTSITDFLAFAVGGTTTGKYYIKIISEKESLHLGSRLLYFSGKRIYRVHKNSNSAVKISSKTVNEPACLFLILCHTIL